jgi:hypothetical protein
MVLPIITNRRPQAGRHPSYIISGSHHSRTTGTRQDDPAAWPVVYGLLKLAAAKLSRHLICFCDLANSRPIDENEQSVISSRAQDSGRVRVERTVTNEASGYVVASHTQMIAPSGSRQLTPKHPKCGLENDDATN